MVVLGRGKSGQAATGTPRLLVKTDGAFGPETLTALQNFIDRCRRHQETVSGKSLTEAERKSFYENSMNSLLTPFTSDISQMDAKALGETLILYKADRVHLIGDPVEAVWRMECRRAAERDAAAEAKATLQP